MTGSNIPTKAVEVSWWFAAAALTATPGPVPLLLNFPEDFGGDSVTGPTSIWALAGSAHFKAWWKPGEKQQTSALSPCRVNVVLWACSPTLQHLMNSYDDWPQNNEQQGRLHYLGPLPQNCPCVSQHQPSKCLSVEGFHSGSQPLLTTIFWTRVFRALPSQPGPVALKGRVYTVIHWPIVSMQLVAVSSLIASWFVPRLTGPAVQSLVSRVTHPGHSSATSLTPWTSTISWTRTLLLSPRWIAGHRCAGLRHRLRGVQSLRLLRRLRVAFWLVHCALGRALHDVRKRPWSHKGRGEVEMAMAAPRCASLLSSGLAHPPGVKL